MVRPFLKKNVVTVGRYIFVNFINYACTENVGIKKDNFVNIAKNIFVWISNESVAFLQTTIYLGWPVSQFFVLLKKWNIDKGMFSV